jgi:hypothetical protein
MARRRSEPQGQGYDGGSRLGRLARMDEFEGEILI